MRIKIGDEIYDGADEMIMVILEDKDKHNLANMPPEATRYCCGPKSATAEEMQAFMKIEDEDPVDPEDEALIELRIRFDGWMRKIILVVAAITGIGLLTILIMRATR